MEEERFETKDEAGRHSATGEGPLGFVYNYWAERLREFGY
jgi:hypothetical protein